MNNLPNIKSAKKRVTVAEHKTLRNKMIKTNLKTSIKSFENAVAQGDIQTAKALYPKVEKHIDMAASKGTIHKNNASRKKASLANKLNTIEKAQ